MLPNLLLSGLIADKLGSYVPAFYVAGSEVLLGACITALLFCFKSPLQQTNDVKSEAQESVELARPLTTSTVYRRNSQDIRVKFKRTFRLVVELHQENQSESISMPPFGFRSGDRCTAV